MAETYAAWIYKCENTEGEFAEGVVFDEGKCQSFNWAAFLAIKSTSVRGSKDKFQQQNWIKTDFHHKFAKISL